MDERVKLIPNNSETYFNKVMISTLAAIKIVDHAIKGGRYEICGFVTGFVKERTFYILDAIELPITGTDARVEVAGDIGDSVLVNLSENLDQMEKIGRGHKLVGWYHSHPGLSCFLSGIDCNTQKMMQIANKTFLALVVDPWKTLSTRRVEMGCYMCFQRDKGPDYVPDVSDIPLYKAEVYIKLTLGFRLSCP
jgi:COP9 signalosome complex subunit 5